MHVPATVYFDVSPGDGEGQLNGRLRVVGADGEVIAQQDPAMLSAGESSSFGPISVEAQLLSQFGNGSTEQQVRPQAKPGQPQPHKPGPHPAGPQQPGVKKI